MAGYADKFMITALRVGREEEIEEKRQKGGMRNRIQGEYGNFNLTFPSTNLRFLGP